MRHTIRLVPRGGVMGYFSRFRLLLVGVAVSGLCTCKTSQIPGPVLTGTWNSLGYGQQLQIGKKEVTAYDVYQGGCALNTQVPIAFIDSYFQTTRLTADSLTLRLGFTSYDFVRISEERRCQPGSASDDALVNFDALWHTFDENYPSFELKGVDWQELKVQYRARLTSQSTALELYRVLTGMTSALRDGHVWIDLPKELEGQVADDEEEEDLDQLRKSVIGQVNARYLRALNTYNKGNVNWGIIADDIGYLQINDFEDLANYSIDERLSDQDFWEQYWEIAGERPNYAEDALSGFRELMSQIYNDLQNTRACIIDLRFNGGGFDQAGLDVLGYFTEEQRLAFRKKARYQNGFTRPQTIFISPNPHTYTGDVYILTSYQTASASETFVLAANNLPQITTIGSSTEGILSDVLSKRLPNGWQYGLSNEVYESIHGTNYEHTGIPSVYDLNYAKEAVSFYKQLLQELQTADRAIEKAIELSKE